jgi:hypothetical protein
MLEKIEGAIKNGQFKRQELFGGILVAHLF